MCKFYNKKTKKIVIGTDEVGRGALAGPVYASSVILYNFKIEKNNDNFTQNLRDSKLLSFKKREMIYQSCIDKKITFGIGVSSVEEIDKLNVLRASMLAMVRSVKECLSRFSKKNEEIIIIFDGLYTPRDVSGPWDWNYNSIALKGGDNLVPEISCASIIAKVTRDRFMKSQSINYPRYDLDKNMGYGTKKHIDALKKFGASNIHRKTFKPTKNLSSSSHKC